MNSSLAIRILGILLSGLALSATPVAEASAKGACNSACLIAAIDHYLDLLTRHDSRGLRTGTPAEIRENTVVITPGQSDSWMKISRVGARQYFTDPVTQNVVVRGAVEMTDGKTGSLSVRLALRQKAIVEIDTSFNQGTGPFDADNLKEPDLIWEAVVPADRRSTREDAIAIANRYFDAISRHEANLAPFGKRCDRYESGKKMTNDFTNKSNESGAVTCGESLLHLTGQEVVQRRFPLVDEERGVVLGYGFILHNERKTPQATGLAEVFKIVDGKLRAIENVETIVASPPDGGFTGEVSGTREYQVRSGT